MTATADAYQASCFGCRFTYSYGDNIDAAERAASKHVMKYPGHVVTIWKSGNQLKVITNDGSQGELPYDGPIARRRDLAKESQRLLRESLDNNRRDVVQ